MRIRRLFRFSLMFLLALLFTVNGTPYWNISYAASHREAPITALDHPADITDWYTFRSYETGREDNITMILDVDPLLEPSNGPNYFPFDPEIVYRFNLDNNQDGVEDIRWDFRFTTQIRLPNVPVALIGADGGINAPANAPNPPIPNPVIPPAITSLNPNDPGSTGINLLQTYTLTITDGSGNILAGPFNQDDQGSPLVAVPSNVGPRTMPNYADLSRQGIHTITVAPGVQIRVFAGTVDDPFYIDLGAAFDSLNLRVSVLNDNQDSNDTRNVDGARDDVSGFNVNAIVLEVPIAGITSNQQINDANTVQAVVGTYGSTLRPKTKTFSDTPGGAPTLSQDLVQIQRMGNPLINELIIGTGSKDTFSMDEPQNDAQFANFFLDPPIVRVLNAATGVPVPNPPRLDLAPLVTYAPPICPACPLTNGLGLGPIADLLRLNTGVPPTPPGSNQRRLGALVGDNAGHPNGRRVFDDVTDIFLRVGAGVLAGAPFNGSPNNRLGDGVNHNDRNQNTKNDLGGGDLNAMGYQDVFPYVAFAHSGRDSRHIDANEDENLGSGDNSGGCAIASAGSNVSMNGVAGMAVILLAPVLYVFGRRFVRKAKKG